MGIKKLLLCCLALSLATLAFAQDLVPAKDKATKRYGYHIKGKDKTWVIKPVYEDAKRFSNGFAEVKTGGLWGVIDLQGRPVLPPVYDKIGGFSRNGQCEVVQKVNGIKLHGVADWNGRIIIPVECRSVSVPKSEPVLYAKYDTALPDFGVEQLWGVYDLEGREIFAPQFSGIPTFSGGAGVAKAAPSGLYGAISMDGQVLLPFQYLNITRGTYSVKTLGTDFSHGEFTPDMRSGKTVPHPGAVIPYDPQNDPIRAAAWQAGPIGRRLYRNNVKRADVSLNQRFPKVSCSELSIDWGAARFIRLEPCVVPAGLPHAMRYASGNRYYTLKALLYEADGRLVREVSSTGWLEGVCAEGALYNAGGTGYWFIPWDPNAYAISSYLMSVTDYRPLGDGDVFTGLGLNVSEVTRLQSLYNFSKRCQEIYEGENVGLYTYLPIAGNPSFARQEREVNRSRITMHRFHMDEVVNCKVKKKGEEFWAELSGDLVLRFKEKFEDPYYTAEGTELIYWGPNNARTVRLELEALGGKSDGTVDDLRHTGISYGIVLNMYEEDGRFLRTLARAPFVDFEQNGILILDKPGIALLMPMHGPADRPIALKPLPHTLSALEHSYREPGRTLPHGASGKGQFHGSYGPPSHLGGGASGSRSGLGQPGGAQPQGNPLQQPGGVQPPHSNPQHGAGQHRP
ncbi:MAG: WG repeat-containing protein [Bacteroidales bacterium]|nr:WG repeat-containing protein [Bacteroidales bacterium]